MWTGNLLYKGYFLLALVGAVSCTEIPGGERPGGQGQEEYVVTTEVAGRLVGGMDHFFTRITSVKETSPADGLIRLDLSCSWQDELCGETQPLPRNVFIYQVDLTRNTLRTTIPRNDETALWSLQTPSEQLRAFQAYSGTTVLGGVNGDYFERASTGGTVPNRPYGVFWKGGHCLKDDFTPWEDGKGVTQVFAVLKDGTARIWHRQDAFSTTADYNAMRDVVCGRLSLIQNGKVLTRTEESNGPRTAIGIDGPGKTAWLLVIDGRDIARSNGASCAVTGRILKALGAVNAFNFDGGGSTTFVARSGGVLTAVNSPCNENRAQRAVANCIAICPLDEK